MKKLSLTILTLFTLLSAHALEIKGYTPDERVVYKTTDETELKLHIFYPKDHQPSDRRPAIVFFFGGGWVGGSPSQFYPQSEYLASRGMVAISAEYRVGSRNQTTPKECVKDGKSALRWIRKHADRLGIDPERIAAGGGSAGGHVAAAAGTLDGFEEAGEDGSISSRPNALVLYNPVFDNGPGGYGHGRVKAYWEAISPLHNIDAKTPPTVVLLGTRDKLIPVATAEKYKQKMEDFGLRCDLHLYKDQPHGFFNPGRGYYEKTLEDVDRFLVSLGYLPALNSSKGPPNILFVLVDDQRNDTLGCAGHPVIQTPTIDRLAAEGVRFENAFVTTPICMASRATIFTGLFQSSHGYCPGDPAGSTPLTDPMLERSFPPLLRQAGYYTGYFGKNHVVYKRGRGGAFNLMFDQWKHIGRSPYFKPMPDGSKRHSAELIGDRSVKFLQERPVDKPFFLFMSFNIAHAEDGDRRPGIGHFPWPKAEDGLYEDITPRPPLLGDPEYFEALPDFLKHSLNHTRWKWRWDTPEKYNTNMRAYYRMLTGMDRIVQRVQNEIERQGLSENTVVIYTADNGYYMGDRRFAGKWSHFEQSLRVPMIVFDPRLPKEKRGRVVPQMALNIDMPSTFLDLAGVSVPDAYQGMSLMPVVRDELSAPGGEGTDGVTWRDGFFCEHHQGGTIIPGWHGFREGRFKYARYDRQNPPFEFLHDLERDPTELKNLASDPEYQEVLNRLRERTDRALAQSGGDQPGAPSTGEIQIPSASSKVIVFDGQHYHKIKDLPALSVDDSMTWRLEVKVDPGCPPGAILMGNRQTPGSDAFLKITPSRGVQLFKNGQHLLLIPATLPRGEWTAVKLVKKGPQFTLYIKGKAAGQATVSQPVPAMPCYLGGDPRKRDEFAKCAIRKASVGAP